MDRCNNIYEGNNLEKINKIREDIKEFKKKVDKVIVLWTGNTEETVEDIKDIVQL